MENKTELKSGYKIALIICAALVLANLVVEVMQMARYISADIVGIVKPVNGLLVSAATLYYAFIGYKKPHGNLLRNVFLIYALLDVVFIVFSSHNKPQYITAIFLFAVVLKAFMAGRLNKYKQNIVIISIVVVCSLVYGTYSLMSVSENAALIVRMFHAFSPFISWATLSVAYLSRYEAHKEAGLADKE